MLSHIRCAAVIEDHLVDQIASGQHILDVLAHDADYFRALSEMLTNGA